MFALAVRFELHENDAAAAGFDQLVAETVKAITENEPGTLVYATHTMPGEPYVRVFYEVYADRAAFDEHERFPHTLRFLAERKQYVSELRVEFLTPAVAKGLPPV